MKKIKKKPICSHDYNNAIKIENTSGGYLYCPLCDALLDPTEWFFITQMESLGAKFINS